MIFTPLYLPIPANAMLWSSLFRLRLSYCKHKMPYIHYIIRYPWTVVRGNGAEIEHHL